MTPELDFGSKLADYMQHPAQMVREMFAVTPEAWQEETLEAFPYAPRIALKSCKGSGKTACLAWLGWNFLLTRPDPAIGATSISGPNLKANLWTEMARWHERSPALKKLFERSSQRIYLKDRPDTWKMEARTWPQDANPEQIGNALAGLHAPYVMWLADESGAYPDAILPTLEAIFSGSPQEAHIVQAGNPLMLSGPLYRACSAARRLWKVIEITADPDNPNRTNRVSKEHAREQIEQYGRDNPWVLVNIFGQFPPSSINALIGPDEVSAAMKRYWRDYDIGDASKIIGIDVARFGDDASCIAKRHGIQAYTSKIARNLTSTQGAGWVNREWDEFNADAAFIDMTGGFGSGWFDQLHDLGRSPVGVDYSSRAHEHDRFYNKRCEMYFEFVQWIKNGGALPESHRLLAALTQTTYTFKGGKMLLEDKEQIKAKIGYSPDEADAFAMTFAEPVISAIKTAGRVKRSAAGEYNPFAGMDSPLPRG